jgi:hypothetical protein
MSKRWTEEQIAYFEANWGKKSLKAIAKGLGKSVEAIEAWRKRHGFETNTKSHIGIPVHEFAAAVGMSTETIYKYWVKQNGLPITKFAPGMGKKKIMVNLDLFWPWAYLSRRFINFSKIEPLALGKEPAWVAECRKQDYNDNGKNGWDRPWTPEEDRELLKLLKAYKYTYSQLTKILNRTELSIQNRLFLTGVKYRPIPESKQKWTPEETSRLIALLKDNIPKTAIASMLGRNQISIKTKVQRLKAAGELAP